MPPLSHCAQTVRRGDRDRFLCTLFASEDARDVLFTLYAFNLEVARIAELVSEPQLGLIRLQWWRNILEATDTGSPIDHPVARELAHVLRAKSLDRSLFKRLLDARERDMEPGPPSDLAALESYAEATSGTLSQLALQALGAKDSKVLEVGRRTGTAWALTGLMRAVPFHAAQGRSYVPRTEPGALRPGPDLERTVAQVGATARAHLAEARALSERPGKAVLAALLPGTLADFHLNRLESAGWNPFRHPSEQTGVWPLMRLAARAMAGRY